MNSLPCPFCRAENSGERVACRTCGSPLKGIAQQSIAPEPKAPQPPTPQPKAKPPRPAATNPEIRVAPQLIAQRVLNNQSPILKAGFWPAGGEMDIVFALADGSAHLWNAHDDTITLLLKPSKKSADARCMALSAKNNVIAAGHENGETHLRAISHPSEDVDPIKERYFKAHEGSVKALAFSGDATILTSGGDDGVIEVWEAATGRKLLTLSQGLDVVTSLAISPDAASLAAGFDNGAVQVWDLSRESPPTQAQWTRVQHNLWVNAVAFSPNGEALASGGYDGTVRIWAVQNSFELHVSKEHRTGVCAVAFAPDNRTIAGGDMQGNIHILDSWTGQLRHSLTAMSTNNSTYADDDVSVAFCDFDNGHLLLCAHYQHLALWRLAR